MDKLLTHEAIALALGLGVLVLALVRMYVDAHAPSEAEPLQDQVPLTHRLAVVCWACGGMGYIEQTACSACGGAGSHAHVLRLMGEAGPELEVTGIKVRG